MTPEKNQRTLDFLSIMESLGEAILDATALERQDVMDDLERSAKLEKKARQTKAIKARRPLTARR